MTILSPSSEDTRIYEVTILYPYKLNQKEEKQILDEVSTVFEEAGAKLIESDMWGRRGLAYTIEGHDEGNFAIFYYEMDPLKVREADEAMLIIPGVLRHMIVKPPKGYELVKYSDQHKKWMKERETESERKGREREEEIIETSEVDIVEDPEQS